APLDRRQLGGHGIPGPHPCSGPDDRQADLEAGRSAVGECLRSGGGRDDGPGAVCGSAAAGVSFLGILKRGKKIARVPPFTKGNEGGFFRLAACCLSLVACYHASRTFTPLPERYSLSSAIV